jgi:hypothetical protein
MSRVGVGMVIDELLTEERLRIRFEINRMEAIAELCLRGFELTNDEIDLFRRTDARLWFLEEEVTDAIDRRNHHAARAERNASVERMVSMKAVS